jgi:hypothetical protein
VAKIISKEVYEERVRRFATELQQSIVAIHPFEDGNGRLSRLMMYKVLQCYSTTSDKEDINSSLPIIEDTGADLLRSKDDWFTDIFPQYKSQASVSLSSTAMINSIEPSPEKPIDQVTIDEMMIELNKLKQTPAMNIQSARTLTFDEKKIIERYKELKLRIDQLNSAMV